MDFPELHGIGRPRWRFRVPALWRDTTTIQIGDDVVIDRLDAATLTWLRGLDGLRTTDEILASLPIPLADARRALRALQAAGALDDASRTPTAARWADRRQRDVLDAHLDALVTVHHDGRVAAELLERRSRLHVAVLGNGFLRDEIALAMESAGIREVGSASKAHLVVLADAHHPEVPAQFDGESLDRPHLHAGAFGKRAVVGPLVAPGATSCLRCAHLHRRDADRAWPLLAVQWSQAVTAMGGPIVDPLLARAAAVQAAVLTCAYAEAPEHPDSWADVAIELLLPDLTAHRLARPPHPLCGCLWQAA